MYLKTQVLRPEEWERVKSRERVKRVREGEEIQDTQTESRKTVTVLGSRAKNTRQVLIN